MDKGHRPRPRHQDQNPAKRKAAQKPRGCTRPRTDQHRLRRHLLRRLHRRARTAGPGQRSGDRAARPAAGTTHPGFFVSGVADVDEELVEKVQLTVGLALGGRRIHSRTRGLDPILGSEAVHQPDQVGIVGEMRHEPLPRAPAE